MSSPHALQSLLQDPRLWRPGYEPPPGSGTLSTGFTALDQALPGGGWPMGTLTEITHPAVGVGEMRLLLPALAALSQGDGWVALVAPPRIPYAPALHAAGVNLSRVLLIHPREHEDTLWSMEQTLRSGNCSAVLAWPHRTHPHRLRRLQLAAEDSGGWCVLFPGEGRSARMPASTLRIRVEPREQGLVAEILKCRGGHPQRVVIDEEASHSGREQAQLPLPLSDLDA